MGLATQTNPNPVLDKVKLGAAALAAIAGIWGFYYLAAYPLIVRLGAIMLGFLLGLAIGWTSEPGKRFYAYTQDSIEETRKVVWPSRKETMQTTGLVVAFVIVMALFLWGVDASLTWLMQMFIGRGA
jgi:preprotein translocase subunit SecE